MLRPKNTKLSLEDKSKIIDLWKHKREQIKHKRHRNNLRRFILIFSFLLINVALGAVLYGWSAPDPAQAINLQGLVQIKGATLVKELKIQQEPAWTLKLKPELFKRKVLQKYPLIAALEFKPILEANKIRLQINAQEDWAWARFTNGWLLAFSGANGSTRIIKDTHSLDFDTISFASSALLVCDDNDYNFWSKQAKNIQKLVYLVSASSPERPLKGLTLNKFRTILHFADLEVILGAWDNGILERAALLTSTLSTLQKYKGDGFKRLDLSNDSRAVLKLETSNSKIKKD
jgi:hypothetical protein